MKEWSNGVLECWSDGFEPNPPLLQHPDYSSSGLDLPDETQGTEFASNKYSARSVS